MRQALLRVRLDETPRATPKSLSSERTNYKGLESKSATSAPASWDTCLSIPGLPSRNSSPGLLQHCLTHPPGNSTFFGCSFCRWFWEVNPAYHKHLSQVLPG